MKKTLVALAVAAVAATSANAAVVYNQDGTKVNVGGSLRLVLNKATDERADLLDDGSRVYFHASHELGEGLSALAYSEVRFTDNGDIGNQVVAKRVWAGFEHKDIGTLTFGKMLTNADAFGVSDITYMFGGANGGFVTSGNKVVHFISKEFNGFSFGADYVFGNSDKTQDKDDAYTAGLFYHNTYDNGLDIGAELGYGHNKATDTKSWIVGLSAGYNGFFLGADYAEDKDDNAKTKTFQVATEYDFNDMSKVYAAYRQSKTGNVKGKEFALGVGYMPHKQVETFLEYNTSKEEGASRNNEVYAGLRVHF